MGNVDMLAIVGLAVVVLGNIVVVVFKYSQLVAQVAHLQQSLVQHMTLEEQYHAKIEQRGDKRDEQITQVITKLASLEATVRAGGTHGPR